MRRRFLTGVAFTTLAISSIMTLSSCSKGKRIEFKAPEFPVETRAETSVIFDEETMLPSALHMSLTDSTVSFLGVMDNKWVHTYNLSSGELISQAVSHGNGPDEVIVSEGFQLLSDSTFRIFEMQPPKIKTFDKDWKCIDSKDIAVKQGTFAYPRLFLPDNRFLVSTNTDYEVSALCIINDTTQGDMYEYNPLETNDTPVKRDPEHSQTKDMYHRERMAVSPDGTKIVSTTLDGAIIEIIDVDGLNLKHHATNYLYPFEIEERGNFTTFKDDVVRGFSAVCATDSLIFAAFLEATNDDVPTDITVWDWDGNPLRRYKTDYQILAMELSPSNPEEIYALALKPSEELQFVRFHCPGLQD